MSALPVFQYLVGEQMIDAFSELSVSGGEIGYSSNIDKNILFCQIHWESRWPRLDFPSEPEFPSESYLPPGGNAERTGKRTGTWPM